MTEQPKKFVVQRSKWLRGKGGIAGGTVLLDRRGHMCCLGFVSAQCGVPDEWLLHVAAPGAIAPLYREPVVGLLVDVEDEGRSDLACVAIKINDAENITDAEREEKLSALFAEHGYEMEFVP